MLFRVVRWSQRRRSDTGSGAGRCAPEAGDWRALGGRAARLAGSGGRASSGLEVDQVREVVRRPRQSVPPPRRLRGEQPKSQLEADSVDSEAAPHRFSSGRGGRRRSPREEPDVRSGSGAPAGGRETAGAPVGPSWAAVAPTSHRFLPVRAAGAPSPCGPDPPPTSPTSISKRSVCPSSYPAVPEPGPLAFRDSVPSPPASLARGLHRSPSRRGAWVLDGLRARLGVWWGSRRGAPGRRSTLDFHWLRGVRFQG